MNEIERARQNRRCQQPFEANHTELMTQRENSLFLFDFLKKETQRLRNGSFICVCEYGGIIHKQQDKTLIRIFFS